MSFENDPRLRPPSFRKIVAKAVISPVNLGVGVASLIGAAAFQLWPIAVLGGAAYLALVAWDLASPSFWKRALTAPSPILQPDKAALPDPRQLTDPQLREAAQALLAARAGLDRVISDSQGEVSVQLAGVGISIDELGGRAARLIQSGEELSRYLKQADRAGVLNQIDRLRQRAEASSDPTAREQYLQTVAARQDQVKALDDLAAALERIQANLARIQATLEGLTAKVVRMGAMDAQADDDLSGDVNEELGRLNSEINTFEETLRHLVAAEVVRA